MKDGNWRETKENRCPLLALDGVNIDQEWRRHTYKSAASLAGGDPVPQQQHTTAQRTQSPEQGPIQKTFAKEIRINAESGANALQSLVGMWLRPCVEFYEAKLLCRVWLSHAHIRLPDFRRSNAPENPQETHTRKENHKRIPRHHCSTGSCNETRTTG